MDYKDVKLNLKEESKVICKTIYDVLPIKWLFVIIAGMVAFPILVGPIDHTIVGYALSMMVGGALSMAAGIFMFLLIPLFWDSFLRNHFVPTYEKHKAELQKEALNKTDDHLLK